MKTASLPGIPFRVLRVLLAVGLWFQADPGRAGNADAPAVVEGKTNMAGGAGVRQPAVAGLFYPREREMLARTVDELLSAAPKVPVEGLRALICPHAGYSYSGVTAARAYQAIQGKRYR
ncbi:MAG TPA: AmmeMemoRadiSam system protein B, partial [Candidatus Paceibacterota bacterium]|nr:AmmeMemoRadiSam system protein B [Candidatus Paceibacterota bacterium]